MSYFLEKFAESRPQNVPAITEKNQRRSEQVGATKAQKREIMKRKAKNKLKTVLDHLSRNKLKYGIGAGALGLAGLGGIGYKMYKDRNK